MGALADLRQLLRVAEQHQVARRAGHRDRVGQTELTGLLDHQQIEAAGGHAPVVGEIPRRATDDAARRVSAMKAAYSVLVDSPASGDACRTSFLRDPRRVDAGARSDRANRFSTTACDCATTPTRQSCSLTSRAMTCAAVYVLPVPGGPCTARYDESRSSSAAVMSAATSPVCGSASAAARFVGGAATGCRSPRCPAGAGRPAAMSAAVGLDRLRRCFAVGNRWARRQRERQLGETAAVLGLASRRSSTSVGRPAVVDFDHRRRCRSRAGRDVSARPGGAGGS